MGVNSERVKERDSLLVFHVVPYKTILSVSVVRVKVVRCHLCLVYFITDPFYSISNKSCGGPGKIGHTLSIHGPVLYWVNSLVVRCNCISFKIQFCLDKGFELCTLKKKYRSTFSKKGVHSSDFPIV